MSDKKLVIWPYFTNSAAIALAILGGFMGLQWAENLAVFYAIVMGSLFMLGLIVAVILIIGDKEDAMTGSKTKAPGVWILSFAFCIILAASGHLVLAIYYFIPGALLMLIFHQIGKNREKAES